MSEEQKEAVFRLRWVVMILMGFLIFGCYYAYDSVVPIADYIIQDLNTTRAQYGLLFSYYSLPNLIMVLLGGILVDRIGIRKAGMLYATLCTMGILTTALFSDFQLMLLGRLLYGIGAESLLVVEIKVLSRWFKGKELAFAMGLNITIVRLGNVASLNLGAPIQSWTGSWRMALWAAFIVMLLSVVSFLIYARLDRKKEKYLVREEEKSDRVELRHIFKFRPSFWYISFLCMTFYSVIFPFVAFSNLFLQKHYGFSPAKGGQYVSLVFIATMIATPLFGILVDKVGKRATMMVIGSVWIVPVFLVLGFKSLHPSLPIIGLGFAYALVPAALWSSIPIMVEDKRLGTAFGLITLIQNGGLTLFPWIAGKITDMSGGDYTNTMIMFAGLGLVAFVFSILLRITAGREKTMNIELPTKRAQA